MEQKWLFRNTKTTWILETMTLQLNTNVFLSLYVEHSTLRKRVRTFVLLPKSKKSKYGKTIRCLFIPLCKICSFSHIYCRSLTWLHTDQENNVSITYIYWLYSIYIIWSRNRPEQYVITRSLYVLQLFSIRLMCLSSWFWHWCFSYLTFMIQY